MNCVDIRDVVESVLSGRAARSGDWRLVTMGATDPDPGLEAALNEGARLNWWTWMIDTRTCVVRVVVGDSLLPMHLSRPDVRKESPHA